MSRSILTRLAGFQFPAALLAILPAFPTSAAAQQASTGQTASPTQAPSHEVVLPVTVRDKHGNLVTNLQASDFTLTEEGRLQTIKGLTSKSDLPLELGLLVDTSRPVAAAMEEERKAAGKFVDQMLGGDAGTASAIQASTAASAPGTGREQAFLLHFDREVELLQDFTASRDKLHREIDDMGPTPHSEDSQGPETTGDDRERPRGGVRNGTQLYDAIFLASDELMRPKQGRKALVVFSDGVDRGSKETMNEALDAADHANVTIYTIYVKGEQDRSGVEYPGNRRGGIGFPGGGGGGYPGGGGGYPGGGRRGGSSEAGVDGRKIMSQIAERTGGRYFDTKKREELAEIYGYVAEELHGQYVLTYTPDKVDNDGGFHKIELKAKNSDLTVVTRAGYYAPGGDAK